ncbi:MAG: efflux RND transporter periplasmic adaptor subunit [Rhodomicrobiaceae bacterium]
MKRFLPVLTLAVITMAAVGFIYKDRWFGAGIAEKMTEGGDPAMAGQSGAAADGTPGSISILAGNVTAGDVPVYLHGVGTVQAFNKANVRAQVSGRLVSVEFEEGEEVRKGDVLARIDPARYQAAYDQLVARKAIGESVLRNAEADLARIEQLAKSNFSSEKAAQTQRALVEQARAQLDQDQASIDSARTDLDHTVIRAPIDGRTGIREVDAGNLVGSGDAGGIVTISQLQPISVVFTLPETHITALIAAQRAGTVALQASAGGEIVGEGKLAVIDNVIDRNTGTIRLKGTFANQPLKLWPGQFVNVRLHLETLDDATVIPIAALQQGASERYVYRITPEGTASMTPVVVAREDEAQAVIASGVEPGDRVAVSGFASLKDGAKVDVDSGGGSGNGDESTARPVAQADAPQDRTAR